MLDIMNAAPIPDTEEILPGSGESTTLISPPLVVLFDRNATRWSTQLHMVMSCFGLVRALDDPVDRLAAASTRSWSLDDRRQHRTPR